MSIFNFALVILGVTWLTAAAMFGARSPIVDFHFLLSILHIGVGFGIAAFGLFRRD